MGLNALNSTARAVLQQKNQDRVQRSQENDQRIIVPAKVISVDDSAGYNRIKAQIVNLNDKSQVFSGTDWASSEEQIPFAMPLLPEYMHVRPKKDEMVLIFRAFRKDPTSPRYWIGPIVTQQTKLKEQKYEDSSGRIIGTPFKGKEISSPSTKNDEDAGKLFAKQDEIAFQGRGTGDLVIGEKFVRLRTGIFAEGTFKENTQYPCNLELKIVDQPPSSSGVKAADSKMNSNFTNYSQQNIRATNINLISSEGKDRSSSAINFEMKYNPRLKDLGDEAKKLHPAVLGDCLVDVISKIVSYLTTHVHPPQKPPIPPVQAVGSEAINLASFNEPTVVSRYLLSRVVRLN